MSDRQGIVVGIDGTLASRAAVDWAVTHADLLGDIQPVYAWDYPIMATAGSPFGYAGIPPTQEMQDAAERAPLRTELPLQRALRNAEPLGDR